MLQFLFLTPNLIIIEIRIDLIGTSNYHLLIKETLQVSLFCLVDIILDLFLVCSDPFFADTTVAPPSEEFHG